MASLPFNLPASPPVGAVGGDALSAVLRTLRLSGSMQFCLMSSGEWRTDAEPSMAKFAGPTARAAPFHIVAKGSLWLKAGDQTFQLSEGDVVAFPQGAAHQLGVGDGGDIVKPLGDLPPQPWISVPRLAYGDGGGEVRLLCGFLSFAAQAFRPFQDALPPVILVRPSERDDVAWLRAMIAQIVVEADRPRPGGLSIVERLTEITFIELLRYAIGALPPGAVGWLAAMGDAPLGRCLEAIHLRPHHDWSLAGLADAAGLSRSALSERFQTMLGASPMRYVRDWRLCLAADRLAVTDTPVGQLAYETGYATEAAFSRAFSRVHGAPPAAWRRGARAGAA